MRTLSILVLATSAALANAQQGPWPPELDFPAGMEPEPYERATYTQEIAVTNGQDRISAVPRSALDLKWRFSGGLDPAVDWTSTLYKSRNLKARQWIGDIYVRNSFGYLQPNRGHRVEFEDGTRFMDVLSTPRGVFEIRERRKVKGRWGYIVHQEFPERAPRGYAGPMKLRDCRTCHVEAGSGEYGVGLVPGGDETLSFPLDGLE